MSSFHDQVLAEIESARKLAAEFASRHGRDPKGPSRGPREAERQVQEETAATEIAALVAEEERLAGESRERAELRAKARAKENARTGEIRNTGPEAVLEPAKSRWNALAILKGLAKLRVKERSAAEELIRIARAIRNERTPPTVIADESDETLRSDAPVRGMWMPSQGETQVWYFTSGGTRCGPVTFAELRTMAASRVLDPRRDLVWKNGMEDWKQAGILDGLFERRSVPADAPDRRGIKPSKPIVALPTQLNAALASKNLSWPGTGRVALWLGVFLFPMIWSEILHASGPTLIATFGNALVSKILPWAAMLPVLVGVLLILTRLVNLGMSRWWALGMAVPIVNLWLAFRCLFCPPGHAYHRKLDQAGLVTALATLVIFPAALWIHFNNPGLLSPTAIVGEIRGWIKEVGNIVGPL